MSRRLIFRIGLILIVFLLTACSGEAATPTPTAVQGVANAAVALLEKDMYLRLTEQSVNNERIETGARMTATQQVMDATATQARHEENAQATRRAEAATQASWQVTVSAGKAYDAATAQAAEAATAQAYLHATSTAEAQETATQQAVIGLTATIEAKATEQAGKETREAPMLFAQQTAVFAEAQKTVIELQKMQATMWAMAWGPIILIVVALLAGLFYLWKKSQVGVIQDENGRVRLVMIDKRALQPELMFDPVIDFSERNGVMVPKLGVAEDIQQQIVHETKIVEAIGRLPPGYQRQALGLAGGMSSAAPAINIQVVQPGNIQGWMDDVQGQISARTEEA